MKKFTLKPVKDEISFEDFAKIDIRVGEKKVFGENSEGMLFDIGYENKITPVLTVPEKYIPNGSSAG